MVKTTRKDLNPLVTPGCRTTEHNTLYRDAGRNIIHRSFVASHPVGMRRRSLSRSAAPLLLTTSLQKEAMVFYAISLISISLLNLGVRAVDKDYISIK